MLFLEGKKYVYNDINYDIGISTLISDIINLRYIVMFSYSMLAKKHQNSYLLECNDCTPKVFQKYDCSKTRLFVAPRHILHILRLIIFQRICTQLILRHKNAVMSLNKIQCSWSIANCVFIIAQSCIRKHRQVQVNVKKRKMAKFQGNNLSCKIIS